MEGTTAMIEKYIYNRFPSTEELEDSVLGGYAFQVYLPSGTYHMMPDEAMKEKLCDGYVDINKHEYITGEYSRIIDVASERAKELKEAIGNTRNKRVKELLSELIDMLKEAEG
jgi:hypothetical protein